jgi:outer membrane protein assembly factor BamB
VPHEGAHRDHGYASPSATTDGESLYVSFGSRGLYAYDLDGHPKWDLDLGDMTIYRWFGEATSPVLHQDTLIINWDHEGESFLTALDAKTGETKWRVDRAEHTSWATPLIVERDGQTQVVVNGGVKARGYDFETGSVLWECGGQTNAIIPTPVATNELVFCMSGYPGSALYAIPLGSQGDITDTDSVAWKLNKDTPYCPSPLLYGNRLWFNKSNASVLTCIDATTGAHIIKEQRIPGLKSVYASPVGAADRVYFTGRDGKTVVLKNSDEFEVLATNVLEDDIDASPAIVGQDLFLRGKKNLYCISNE